MDECIQHTFLKKTLISVSAYVPPPTGFGRAGLNKKPNITLVCQKQSFKCGARKVDNQSQILTLQMQTEEDVTLIWED